MGRVFINYRVKDNPLGAASIHDLLARRFGYDNVFRDCVSMQPGDHYPTKLREGLNQADVLIVVIGPHWNTVGSEHGGTPHIQRTKDWVRWEIATAIERGIPVIPVLLTDLPEPTERPNREILPDDIRELANYQIFELSQRRFGADVDRLVTRLAELVADLGAAQAAQVFGAPPPKRTADHVPSTLLRPEYQVVPFEGRTGLLDDLRSWAADSRACAVRLMVGPPGAGKTRLARELCRLLAVDDWRAGIVPSPALATQTSQLGAISDKPLLVVVDNAAASTTRLATPAAAISDRPHTSSPVRLLLLDRAAGNWLTDLRKHTDNRVSTLFRAMTAADTLTLDAGTADRHGKFARAYTAFTTQLGQDEAVAPISPSLTSCESLLDIHAAALDSVLSTSGLGTETVHEDASPLARILCQDRWHARRLAQRDNIADLDTTSLNAISAVATLCRPASEAQAASLHSRLGNFLGDDRYSVDQYVEFLSRLYPAEHPLCAVQPAALGENLVATTLASEQPSIATTLAANCTNEQITNALTVLGQAYVRHRQLATVIVDLLRVDPDRLIPITLQVTAQVEQPETFARLISTALSGTTIRPDHLLDLISQLGQSRDNPATNPIAVAALDAFVDSTYQWTDHIRQNRGVKDTPLTATVRTIADGLTTMLRETFAAYLDPSSGRLPKDVNGNDLFPPHLLTTFRTVMALRKKMGEDDRDQGKK